MTNKRPEWVKWYKRVAWLNLRRSQLSRFPLCAFCEKEGVVKEAGVVDHIKPHKGNPVLFFDRYNLQSLCKRHHDSHKQRMEKSGEFGCNVDGTFDGWE